MHGEVAREDQDADDYKQSAAGDLQLMQMTTKASVKSEEAIDAERGQQKRHRQAA